MEKQSPPVTDPHRRNTAEDTTANSGSRPLSRSTVRGTQTPRATRTGDHHSRPGALPPAPGRLFHAALLLRSRWFPLVLLAVLVVVTEQVIAKGPLLGIDRWMRGRLLHLVASNPYPSLNTYARWWTHFGSPEIAVTALVLATLASAARTRSWKPVLAATLAGTALFATVIPGKILIGRPGLEGWLVGPGDLGWYPSGHTSTASVCLGAAAWILATAFALPARLRRALYAATAALCASVGFTLMWCDYHWFLDVVGALCLSGVILWSLIRWTPQPSPKS
jgi:membrane-associated phospholipid phosphatase